MKYKNIFKWELFAGIAAVILINFILLNLVINTAISSVLDRELNKRLDIIGRSIQEDIGPGVFLLSPEDNSTVFYRNTLEKMKRTKDKWSMDISFVNLDFRPCISTKDENPGSMVFNSSEITVFDRGVPEKTRLFSYMESGKLMGYIHMHMRGPGLVTFNKVRRVQLIAMAVLFVFAMVIVFVFSHFITRRINYTVTAMEKISKGGDVKPIKVDWIDEFSYLQDQINHMVMNLKELEESRLKEIQIVAMGLAHEIKNPAGAILNLAELAEKKAPDDKQRERLEKIKQEVRRLNSITDKFIHFAREKEVVKERVIFRDFYNILKEQYENVIIKYEGASENDMMEMDPVLMERAVKNLVKNAYEAGASEVEIKTVKGDKIGALKVSDNAPLIPDDVKDKIFISFYTTKSDGMGIGLAITKNIIEKHDGRIEYRQDNGRNVFEITVPVEKIIITEEPINN